MSSTTYATIRRADRLLDHDALHDITPVVVSVVPFAAIIGVVIGQADRVPTWAALLAGPLMYAGSAQLAALTLLESGAGAITVLLSVMVVNARLSLYGALVEPHFRDQPTWFRWFAPHFLVDQTYAIVAARDDLEDPQRFLRYWLTAGGVLGVAWTGTMSVAAALGPVIPPDSPLTFAAAAVFIGLLTPQLRAPVTHRPAAIAAMATLLAAPLPNGLALLVGITAGITPAFLQTWRSS